MEVKSMTDGELVSRLKAGCENAFNTLFYRYERRLYAFSFRLLFSVEDAEEVVQEVFYKIWKNKDLLEEHSSFKAFIFTIARNHIYNQLSKRVSETAYKHYCAGEGERQASSTEDAYNFQELRKTVQEMANRMPAKRKQVFLMSRFEGQSNREIASQLELSLSTVENHLNKALKFLKQHLYMRGNHLLLLFIMLWD
jgi:RNA polymerase sigma-70 factor (family 1)